MTGSPCADLAPRLRPRLRRSTPPLADEHLRRALEAAVAPALAVARGRLWAGRRGRPVEVLARQVAMYLAHVAFGLTFAEVARLFARDPRTVARACALVEDRRDCVHFDRSLELLESALRLLSPCRA
jgi:chromosomal replication initiation ATPase DnaA